MSNLNVAFSNALSVARNIRVNSCGEFEFVVQPTGNNNRLIP